jgi:transaldolase/transaldolase/glucose-6-phosphate isomerase
MKNNLFALATLGQSPWYDNIDRRLIQSGELKRFFDDGVTGVTSNPSIFEKAVTSSSVYDQTIEELAKDGYSPERIYDVVTVQDVQVAADLLKAKYDSTQGQDGYVSLEVLPRYAQDAKKTIENAKRLSEEVGRENLMIKVPGTAEGEDAIRALTAEGINVNVTLLFSQAHYERAARAYTEGLRDRLARGAPLDDVCSVASVFVSRVDTLTDKQLEEMNAKDLLGKIAVANAKVIYQRFKVWFKGDPFSELREKGARVQRVLWGSTSTKNPDYYDVKYVDELIGKETINTLPHSTLLAFLDHGEPKLTLEENLDQEKEYLEKLEGLGIDLDKNCEILQEQGVHAFSTSFDQLIDAIVTKAK